MSCSADSQDYISFHLFGPQGHSEINYIDQEASYSGLGYVARARFGADMSSSVDGDKGEVTQRKCYVTGERRNHPCQWK